MEKSPNRVTSREVALAAGVSRQTVSRILNGTAPALVTANTRERVLHLAAELGYVPNAAARQLRTQRSYCLGLALPFPAHYVMGAYSFTEALRGMTEVTDAEGYSLLICPPSKQGSAAQMLRDGRVDGVVAVHAPDEDELTALLQTGRPVVLMNRTGDQRGLSWVDVDNFRGVADAMTHLLVGGRRRIAVISSWPHLLATAVRLRAYRETLAAWGVAALTEHTVMAGDPPTPEEGLRAMTALLGLAVRPDAVLCCGDQLAIGALSASKAAGLRVPADVAVIGMGDEPTTAYQQPPLSTISPPYRAKGKAAARLLIDLIEGKQEGPQSVLLQPELVVRGSA